MQWPVSLICATRCAAAPAKLAANPVHGTKSLYRNPRQDGFPIRSRHRDGIKAHTSKDYANEKKH